MSMGCLNNIISNSKYYSYVFWFSVSSAILAVVLNVLLIKTYGILGAAIATLAVILFINLSKIILVQSLFKIHPYSLKSLGVIFSIALIYVLVYGIPSLLNPWLSIMIRSLLIVGLFCIPMFTFRWSSDILNLVEKTRGRLF
jgi:O-antigen/teichoic acid export membrane protein